jgi:glutathione S-transferase
MKLYIHPISLANRPARLFIAEYNIRVDEQDVGLLKSEHFQPPSATVNPNGQVLVLECNGLRIIENSAILKYLANKVNSPAWPKDLKRRRRRRLWTSSTPSTIASKVTASSIHRFPEQQVPERRGAASPPRLNERAEMD